MTREDHLKFCKICKNQRFDARKGIVCMHTNEYADFEDKCSLFEEDEKLRNEFDIKEQETQIMDSIASRGVRFVNFLLDYLFIMIYTVLLGMVLGIIVMIFSPDSLSYLREDNKLIEYIIAFIFMMTYYTIMEYTTGQTLAKFITKTKVVNENGEKPGFGTILLRSLCRFIPFEPLSFLTSEDGGLHDKLSKTIVVKYKE